MALFGPTSQAEIERCGRGIKLASDAPCVGGYRTDCDVQPSYMQRITSQTVYGAVMTLLDRLPRA